MKEKRFTVVVSGENADKITEKLIERFVQNNSYGYVLLNAKAFEHNKTHTCDGCGKQRRDVKSCGKDSNGDPDAPDLCFICRKQGERGKHWSFKEKRYIPAASFYDDLAHEVENTGPSWGGL